MTTYLTNLQKGGLKCQWFSYTTPNAIQTFTWPAGVDVVWVTMVAGGGGGGSGSIVRRYPYTGWTKGVSGGAGGAGSGFLEWPFYRGLVATTCSVIIGGGGAGGAARVIANGLGAGFVGTDGGNSQFGTLIAYGGKAGAAGGALTHTYATNAINGASGGNGGGYTSGAAGSNTRVGSGGVSSASVPSSAVDGSYSIYSEHIFGGAGGGASAYIEVYETNYPPNDRYAGIGGASPFFSMNTRTSAGGGASSLWGPGGVGGGAGYEESYGAGAGGIGGGYGAGGGGGGRMLCNTNLHNSGAGGAGADGFCLVTWIG